MNPKNTPPGLETLHRIVNGSLRNHAPTLAVIGFSGDVAVVLHDAGERARARARALGWDGVSEVFRLSPEGRRTLAASTEPSDAGVAKWLGKKFEPASPVARIYVLTGDDALLVNYSAFGGWALEPPAPEGQLPS